MSPSLLYMLRGTRPQVPAARCRMPDGSAEPSPTALLPSVYVCVCVPSQVGYNAMYDRIEDLIAAGVLDPAKVTRSGLINACSIAGIMLTTQVRGRRMRSPVCLAAD